MIVGWCLFFFFKQKTAYEMRISDWSSDVCSSDLLFQDSAGCLPGAEELAAEAALTEFGYLAARIPGAARDRGQSTVGGSPPTMTTSAGRREIGRASGRESACQYG